MANREATWSLINTSQLPVIMLVAQGALADDAKVMLKIPARLTKENEFQELGVKKLSGKDGDRKMAANLFGPGKEYGVAIADEIHVFRQRVGKRLPLSALFQRSHAIVGMTATPIITTPMVNTFSIS